MYLQLYSVATIFIGAQILIKLAIFICQLHTIYDVDVDVDVQG
jgi:hypothetical protein